MIKTKNQSIIEFLEALQREYFVAMLRSKIYPSKKKKNYFRKVAKGKEEKINNISAKYELETIFDDPDVWDSVQEEIFGTLEKEPKFLYRDKNEVEELEVTDSINYYSNGSDVQFKSDLSTENIGKILINGFFFQEVKVIPKNSSNPILVELKNLKRIL